MAYDGAKVCLRSLISIWLWVMETIHSRSLRKLILEVGVRAVLGGQLIPGQDAFENCSTDGRPQFLVWVCSLCFCTLHDVTDGLDQIGRQSF